MADASCAERADDGADEADGHGEALFLGAQAIEADQGINGAGDDYGVKTEEQSAEGAGKSGFHQVGIWAHRLRSVGNPNPSYRLGGQRGKVQGLGIRD